MRVYFFLITKDYFYRAAGERIFNFSQYNNINDLVFEPYLVYII
jgi:hypothetical protein